MLSNKKKIKTCIILTFIINLIILNNFGSCTVNSKGRNILFVGGNGEGNYSTIQQAIDNASENDIIFVYSGLYKEYILINKSLIIIGEEKNSTIVDGCKNNFVVQIYANDTKFSNFTVQNSRENGGNRTH